MKKTTLGNETINEENAYFISLELKIIEIRNNVNKLDVIIQSLRK